MPAAYLEENAELAYAGNVYVAQGRTVDTAHLVVSEGMTRDLLYVGMTRGRERNQAHVVTGPADPADLSREERDAYTAAAIIRAAGLLERGDRAAALAVELEPPEPDGHARAAARGNPSSPPRWSARSTLGTATEAMRAAADFPVHTRHLYEIREAFWWKDVAPQIDDMVRARIGEHDYQRYLSDPERPAFLQELRRHEIGGRPITDVLDSITAAPLDGVRSVAAVLHGRAGKEPAPARGDTTTWAERTGHATPEVRAVDAELDRRQAELGEQLAAEAPRWAVEAWGRPPAEPGALLEDWKQRAAVVESYRELAGITDPAQAIGPAPARQAGMSEAFAASVRALELADDAAMVKAMGRGELEARVREYARAEAVAPADLSAADPPQRRGTRLHPPAGRGGPGGRGPRTRPVRRRAGRAIAAEGEQMRIAQAARDEWAEATAPKAEAASAARAELRTRGTPRWDEPKPKTGRGRGGPRKCARSRPSTPPRPSAGTPRKPSWPS